MRTLDKIASNESDPTKAMDELLEACVSATGASSGRLYILMIGKSTYELAWEVGSEHYDDKIHLRALEEIVAGDRDPSPIEEAILSLTTIRPDFGDSTEESKRSRLVVPVVRQHSCLGVVDLDSVHPEHFGYNQETLVRTAASIMSLLIEKQRSLKLFKELHRPISYHQEEADFYAAIMGLVADASQMHYIVLRELVDGQLVCLASHGFPHVAKERLDLAPLTDYPTFVRAVEMGKVQAESTMEAANLSNLKSKPQLGHVKSFVAVPVKVGTRVFGTLSFGAECPYEYSDLETNGYETIANSIGVGIANYRNFHAIGEQSFQHGKISADLTAVEVAQAARHEARGYLSEVRETLIRANRLAKRGNRSDMNDLVGHIASLDELIQDVEISIDRIKDATSPPASDAERVELHDLWEEAFAMVRGRLSNLRITASVDGRASATVYRDHLRHVFLNLVLNSADAFSRKAKKGNRKITVTIDQQSEGADHLLMRYVDNAIGIDASKLPLDPDGQVRPVESIFERDITTKPEGSGFGLFLARSILQRHKGSINLVSYRNGVVFDVILPKDTSSKSILVTDVRKGSTT